MQHITDILKLAEAQHALVTRKQLRSIGVDCEPLETILENRLLEPVTFRVLRLMGAPVTNDQRLMAATLDVGGDGVLTHAAALRKWGVPGMPPEPVDVGALRSSGAKRSPLAVLHELRALPPELRTTLGNIPIVRPELALYQFCGMVHPDRAERAIDAAWRKRLVTGPSMRRALSMLAKRGRNGTRAYRMLLEPRGPDYIPTDSGIETRFAQLLRNAGERPMRRQVDCGGETWDGCVDFLDDDFPLIVEIQSEMYHTALVDRAADAVKRANLEEDGFSLLPIWDTEIWTQPGQVVAKVRAERRRLATVLAAEPVRQLVLTSKSRL